MKNNTKEKVRRCDIMNRDIAVLRYLWKWKAVSTLALAIKFFPKSEPITAYCRLMRLKENNFIKTVHIDERWNTVWTLADRGFKYIEPMLLHLESHGYKSENVTHDYLTTAFHVGEWLTNQPEYTQTYSEQQLRRIIPDAWDTWVPTSELHRPDGYSLYYQGENQVIVAFEAELTLKAKDRYERVVTFYDNQTKISFVFWLVDSKNTLNAIRRAFEKFNVKNWSKLHFILLSDFLEKGWMAQFIEGKYKGRTPIDFFVIPRPSTAHPDPFLRRTQLLLDTTKKPIKSNVCAQVEKLKKP